MRAERSGLQCRGNETQHSELRTAAAAVSCVFICDIQEYKEKARQVFSWLQEDGFYLLCNTLFLQCWINCRLYLSGMSKTFKTGQSHLTERWSWNQAIPVLTVPWDIHQQVHCLNHHFFQLLPSYLLAAPPYLCACKSLKKWTAIPGPNEKCKPINTAHMCPQPKMKAVFSNQHLTLLLKAPFWSLQ